MPYGGGGGGSPSEQVKSLMYIWSIICPNYVGMLEGKWKFSHYCYIALNESAPGTQCSGQPLRLMYHCVVNRSIKCQYCNFSSILINRKLLENVSKNKQIEPYAFLKSWKIYMQELQHSTIEIISWLIRSFPEYSLNTF